ncbi:MAG: DUF3108 domain-containing protein [Anaeromyxobacter sp.]
MTRAALMVASIALSLPALAAPPAGFAPGEETVFRVRWLGIPTGEGRMLVGQPQGDVWPVIVQGRTAGLATVVSVREHLVTYWDAPAALARGSELWAREPGDEHRDRTWFDRAAGTATVTVQRNGRQDARTAEVPPDTQDLTGAVLWLRLQPLEVGQELEVPVLAGTRHFRLRARVVAREQVSTPAGTFPTFKLEVRTALDGAFSTRRDSTLWLADDPSRFLVKASAEFALGSVVAELERYRPGTRVARAD